MHKKNYLIISLFILLLTTGVSAENYYQAQELVMTQTISNAIELIPGLGGYSITSFDAILHHKAQESYRQDIIREEATPSATIEDGSWKFSWTEFFTNELTLQTTTQVRTSAAPVEVTTTVPFPLEQLPEEIEQYITTTNYIDINNDIQELAQSIASEYDDQYLLVHALGTWVTTNIEYNLSTLTQNANQPSSLVLRQRYGVCDELTNLFISLNRALGIPARFVSGIAYTDSELFDENWGNHGWAEVYFPDYGWIPYDVTYGQYGYIDATHIELKKGVDGTKPSINYYGLGNNFDFQNGPIDFDTVVNEQIGTVPSRVNIELDVEEDIVGFESFNLLTATITNDKDYYVTEEIILGQTLGTTIYGEDRQQIVIPPKNEVELQWLLGVDSLDSGFIYTFPMKLVTGSYQEFETEFEVREGSEVYPRNFMEQFIVAEDTTNAFIVSCSGPQSVNLDATLTITCNTEKPSTFCWKDTCKEGISATFDIPATTPGIATTKITTTRGEESVQRFITYTVVDNAQVAISIQDIPQEIRLGEKIPLVITLEKTSRSNPTNILLVVEHNNWKQEWELPLLDQTRQFQLDVDATSLNKEENEIVARVVYTNKEGTQQTRTTTQTYLILEGIGENINVFFSNLLFKLTKLVS